MSCNNSPITIDVDTIDELVAGNLEGDRYRQVLNALEAQPEKWRDCALAFLEEQAIARDLQMISSAGKSWSTNSGAEQQQSDQHIDEGSQAVTVTSESVQTQGQVPNYARLQWMHRITSLAAMLLISFTVGWFGSGMLKQNQPASTDPVEQLSSVPSETLAPSNSGEGSMRMVSDQMIPMRQSPPPSILQELQRARRIELESTDMLVPVLEGDSVIFVPVQQHRVRSRSPF